MPWEFGRRRSDAARHNIRILVPGGACLFFYTDGLVERRDRSIVDGMNQLVGSLTCGPAETMCTTAMTQLFNGQPVNDDTAMLAIRRTPPGPPWLTARENPNSQTRAVAVTITGLLAILSAAERLVTSGQTGRHPSTASPRACSLIQAAGAAALPFGWAHDGRRHLLRHRVPDRPRCRGHHPTHRPFPTATTRTLPPPSSARRRYPSTLAKAIAPSPPRSLQTRRLLHERHGLVAISCAAAAFARDQPHYGYAGTHDGRGTDQSLTQNVLR